MKTSEFGKHSKGIQNYIKSIIEVEEPVEKKEFIKTYMKLSKGRKKRVNAKHSFNKLSKEKLIKFV